MNKVHLTFGKVARVLTTLIAFVALMSSVLTVVLESTAGATGTITEATGFPQDAEASSGGLTSLSITPAHVGDLLILESQIHSQSIVATGVTGAGTGTWTQAESYVDTTNGVLTEQIWWSVATATAATSVNVTYSASTTGVSTELVADSFTSTTSSGWSFVTSGGAAATTTSAIAFPSLTSGSATNQLYWGYAESATSAGVAGSSTGFTYNAALADASGNITTYDAGLSATTGYSPTATQAAASNTTSTAAIFSDSPGGSEDAVAFNSEGGNNVSSINGVNAATITLPAAPTFAGHTFNGWYTAATGGTLETSPYTLTGSLTLFAQWTTIATFTVTFLGNTNTGGATAAETESAPTALTANGFTKTGDTFTGWNTLASGQGINYAPGATYPFTASINLYAQWTVAGNSYTVTFNANSGTGTMAPQSATTATALTANAFTYTGFTFAGWNTQASGTGGTTYSDGAVFPFTESLTLYAQWTVSSGGGGGGGGGGGTTTLTTLSVAAENVSITVGGTVTPSATVAGLISPDTGTATATYTYAGTGSTTYAASTTAPTAAGTYSITPSAATVTVSPSTDAGKYSTTYTYVPGTLTITAAVTPPPVVIPGPHAIKVIGHAIVGETRTITITGRDFTTHPGVTSNESGATVRVRSKSANRIVLSITVRAGIRPGTHDFTITASGKRCRIGFVTR
jgi:uncharacterized repeat protein (TIGR02543 family)